jgi:flagellar secretion chaperone FliS
MNAKPGKNTSEYLKTKIMTASSEQLQLMLYDGAIRFCEQARSAIEAKDIEGGYTALSKAENIVLELQNGLRDEVAPEICTRMRALYLYCYEQLVKANLKRQVSFVDDALKILRHLRETWVMVMEKLKNEKIQAFADQPIIPENRSTPKIKSTSLPVTDSLNDLEVGATLSIKG